MANHHLFVWQRSLPIAVVAAALGFVAGVSFPVGHFVNHKSAISKTLPHQQKNSAPKTSAVKVLMLERDEAYQKVIARLVHIEKAQRLNFFVPVQFQGKTIREVKLNSNPKATAKKVTTKPIALTFDDGPWPNTTSEVLDVLKKNNVKATFFVVGRQVQKYPQLMKQIVDEGHAIGNHTWSHQYHHYNEPAAAHELDSTAALVYKTTGVKTSLFRPPAGILNNGLVGYAHEKKYAVVMWSVDTKDWSSRRTTAQGFIDLILKNVKPGGIVLLHDGGGNRAKTVQALPQLIAQLKKRGYEFATVPELLEMGNKKPKPTKTLP